MKRWLLLGAAYLALTLLFAAPLLPRFFTAFPHDAGDPLLNTWLLWWNTQQLPFSAAWWQAPMFHPAPDVMALSEVLVGLLPITALTQWVTSSPVAAYNAAFILSFPLCGLATAWLVFTLTSRRDLAALAGLAFVFAPYRLGQLSHLQMLAYYGAPLALAALHRYDQTTDRRWLALFGGAWLLQALTNGYALFHLSVLIGLWLVWFARTRRAWTDVLLAWFVAALPVVPMLLKYQAVHERWHLLRDINEIKRFGVDLADFISAPPESLLWGQQLWTARPETAVFPGIAVVIILGAWAVVEWRMRRARRRWTTLDERILLAISMVAAIVAVSALTLGPWRVGPVSVGDFHKPFSIAVYARLLVWLRSRTLRDAWQRRSVVGFYVVACIAMYLLAMGPEPTILGRPMLYEPPYAWLMRLPGFASLRVPGRFALLGVLCQVVLLAYGVDRLSRLAPRFSRALPIAIAVLVIADGWATLPVADTPIAGPAIESTVAAVAEVPIGEPQVDFGALYRQMSHRRPVVNGYSGYNPPHYLPLSDAFRADRADVLAEIDRDGMLEVVVDRWRADTPELEAQVSAIAGAQRLPADEHWFRFLVPQHRAALPVAGKPIQVDRIRATVNTEEIARVTDGRLDTAWHSGLNQIGNEEIALEFGAPRQPALLVLDMGPLAFGYPRLLEVDGEDERGEWVRLFDGPTAAMTVRAALDESARVPLSIPLERAAVRRLRLRQAGHAAGIPWWVAELRVFEAPASQ